MTQLKNSKFYKTQIHKMWQKRSKFDKIQKLEMWQNWREKKINTDKTKQVNILLNAKTQIWKKKKKKCDKNQKLQIWQNSKTQNVTKLKDYETKIFDLVIGFLVAKNYAKEI